MPANSSDNNHFISIKNQSISNLSHSKKNIELPIKNHFISTENNSKNSQLINFCYDILQELDIKSSIHPFYEILNENIKNSIDLFTIISKLENNQYARSEMHILGEKLESTFNKIWTEKIDFQVKQKENLKRTQNNNTDSSSELVTKQIRILEQNKDKSQISLSSANEPVLQAIVENLLPLKYCIPELLLVMDSTKLKGFGRFGYSDIFILKGIGNNNISLELKYIPLVGLIKNQKKEV
ncbi:unnamed protein product [Rhizophagus irregularis]|nr:unnamed protein product [Rhizophagus irregularis]